MIDFLVTDGKLIGGGPADSSSESQLGDFSGDCLEIQVEFMLGGAGSAQALGIRIKHSANPDEDTIISYEQVVHSLSVILNRLECGSRETTSCPIKPASSLILHVFVDRSSFEVFVNEGQQVLSNRIYPSQPGHSIGLIAAKGTAEVKSFQVWSLNSICKQLPS